MTSRYIVTYAPRARRDLRRLPEKIATACVKFIRTVLVDDPAGWQAAHLVMGGNYSARRSEWRIIYHIDDHEVLIEVVTVAHRADSYRPR